MRTFFLREQVVDGNMGTDCECSCSVAEC